MLAASGWSLSVGQKISMPDHQYIIMNIVSRKYILRIFHLLSSCFMTKSDCFNKILHRIKCRVPWFKSWSFHLTWFEWAMIFLLDLWFQGGSSLKNGNLGSVSLCKRDKAEISFQWIVSDKTQSCGVLFCRQLTGTTQHCSVALEF